MARVRRNAPCPCGSGRKHKHCCAAAEERLAQEVREDNRVGRAIADWSAREHGDELSRAFEEFHPEGRRIEERDLALLLTWFNSDRELRGGGTPVERYLARPDLDPGERAAAERIAAARLGLHRVRAVMPGHSVELENVLTDTPTLVASQAVSHQVACWDLLLCRVMPGEPASSLWGPALIFAPDEEPELRAELERLAGEHGFPRDLAGLAEIFRVASRELLRFDPPSRSIEPILLTVEGDPIVSARALWRLVDPAAAIVTLNLPPDLLWIGESEDETGECFQLTADRAELLAGRPLPPPGALYFESSFDGLPERIGIGTFDLCGRELRFDALSEARLERAIDLVSVLLAGNAELIHREIASIDLHRPARADASAVAEADALGSDYLVEYLRRWLDEPLARLGGATPRVAASIPKLRGEVELLLRSIENRAEHAHRSSAAWPDVRWLRAELGFTSQLAA